MIVEIDKILVAFKSVGVSSELNAVGYRVKTLLVIVNMETD